MHWDIASDNSLESGKGCPCKVGNRHLLNDMKTQKGLADDYFVALDQRLRLTGLQSLSPIYKGPVGRSKIFEKVSPIASA